MPNKGVCYHVVTIVIQYYLCEHVNKGVCYHKLTIVIQYYLCEHANKEFVTTS